MDLMSMSRETFSDVVQFAKTELTVWMRVIRNPRSAISELNFETPEAVFLALRFAIFVLGLSMLVELPEDVVFLHLKIQQPVVILTDLISNFLGLVQIGFLLYIGGKAVLGRGNLGNCMLTGFYLSAFWPLALLPDYFWMASQWGRDLRLNGWDLSKASEPGMSDVAAVIGAGIAGIAMDLWLIVKTVPVIKELHSIGAFRAILVLIIGLLGYLALLFLVFEPILRSLSKP